MSGEVGEFLADGGAIVGGGAVLGATVGFVAGSLVRDFRPQTDPEDWARVLGFYGGVLGMAVLLIRA
jgi:hypothetical protein